MWCFITSLPPGAPSKVCTALLWGQRNMSTEKWMVFGPIDMAHYKKFPLHQRHLKKTNSWTQYLWLLVSPVAGVTPLALLQNELLDAIPLVGQSSCRCDTLGSSSKPPLSSDVLSLGAPASLISLSQTSSDIWFRDRNPALLCTLFTDCWLRNEYSVRFIITHLKRVVTQWNAIYLKRVVTQWNAIYLKRVVTQWNSIYFSPVRLNILQTSLFISTNCTSWNYNPMWRSPTTHLNISITVWRSMASNSSSSSYSTTALLVWPWLSL